MSDYSPTWNEIDEVIAKYTAVDMAKRLLELERQVRLAGPGGEVIRDAIVASAMERGWSHSGAWAVAEGAIERLAAPSVGPWKEVLYKHPDALRDELKEMAAVIRDAFTYDPGHSDLDNEQPIHISVTLGDWRRLNYALMRHAATGGRE